MSATAEVAADVDALARYFADSGQVIAGFALDDGGRARSWWWPLPAARDRAAIAALCADGSLPAQQSAALQLATAVDRAVRDRLRGDRVSSVVRKSGRRSIEQAWLASLTTADPWLAGDYDPDALRAFERAVARWVASGAATMGSVRLC